MGTQSMSYFGDDELVPVPSPEDAPFWDNCAKKRLAFQSCGNCGAVTHPPLGVCPKCQSLTRDWVDAPQGAQVFTYTWVNTAARPGITRPLPYNVAVIEFDGLPGVRMVSNVVDAEHGKLAVGDKVHLVWELAGPEMFMPRFRRSIP